MAALWLRGRVGVRLDPLPSGPRHPPATGAGGGCVHGHAEFKLHDPTRVVCGQRRFVAHLAALMSPLSCHTLPTK
eukprot:4485321-Prymnesium_polylepis.1